MNINQSLYDIADNCQIRLEQLYFNPQSEEEDSKTLISLIESMKNMKSAILESER